MGNDATECQKESQAGVIEGTLRKPRRDPVSFPPGQQQNRTLVRLEPEAEADFTQESIFQVQRGTCIYELTACDSMHRT